MKNLTELQKAQHQIQSLTFEIGVLKQDKERLNNKLHKAEMQSANDKQVKLYREYLEARIRLEETSPIGAQDMNCLKSCLEMYKKAMGEKT